MLHSPKTGTEPVAEAGEVDAMASAVNFNIQSEAPTVNPNGFLVFAAVFGVGTGIGALTWIADLFQKTRKRKSK